MITGEGFLDEQSFEGKVVGGVAALAAALGVPVVAIAGQVYDGGRRSHRGGQPRRALRRGAGAGRHARVHRGGRRRHPSPARGMIATMTDDLSRLDATAQAELVRTGEASPRELVDAAIERIERVNPELNAVITPLFERARAAAAGDLPDGPFRGVPFVLKDLSAHSAGDPFHEGMAFLKERGWTEPADTALAARFRAAGLVTVGQDEHARARHPPHHRAAGLRPDPQPVGHHPLHRRLERRVGGGGGRRARADRRTPTTAAGRSASRPASAGWSASSRPGRACRRAPSSAT